LATAGNNSRRMMHVHHIKPFDLYPELRCDPNNLILLCAKCHYAEHKRMRMGVMPKCQGIS